MRDRAGHGEPGVEIFVYGVSGGGFPARQHESRRRRAWPDCTASIPSGRCSSSSPRMRSPRARSTTTWSRWPTSASSSAHEKAFADRQRPIEACGNGWVPGRICRGERRRRADRRCDPVVPVQRAAGDSARRRDGADPDPTEARETWSAWAWIDRHLASNGPIRRVEVVDVRQSMANGGGPACLRLRVVCDPATVDPRFLVDASRLDQIAEVIASHWPEQIHSGELQQPALIREHRDRARRIARCTGLGRVGLTRKIPKRDVRPFLTATLTLSLRGANGSKLGQTRSGINE